MKLKLNTKTPKSIISNKNLELKLVTKNKSVQLDTKQNIPTTGFDYTLNFSFQ